MGRAGVRAPPAPRFHQTRPPPTGNPAEPKPVPAFPLASGHRAGRSRVSLGTPGLGGGMSVGILISFHLFLFCFKLFVFLSRGGQTPSDAVADTAPVLPEGRGPRLGVRPPRRGSRSPQASCTVPGRGFPPTPRANTSGMRLVGARAARHAQPRPRRGDGVLGFRFWCRPCGAPLPSPLPPLST